MNWYKKQLMRIADSCILNNEEDIKILTEMLNSDFNIKVSKKEIKKVLQKISENKKNAQTTNDILLKLSRKLSDQDALKLKDLLVRYSEI
tara:strand:- start:15 stop:284 length:270 start_codon:yes stop_codon:yes gene_type:complete